MQQDRKHASIKTARNVIIQFSTAGDSCIEYVGEIIKEIVYRPINAQQFVQIEFSGMSKWNDDVTLNCNRNFQ
jgi:hypothetical protein